MKLFPLLLLAGAAACTPPDNTIDIVFDPCEPLVLALENGTAPQQDRARAAIAMWNELAEARLSIDPDHEEAEAPRLPVRFEPAGRNFHGYYDDERAVVYINDAIENERKRAVTLAHELGHAFGLKHVDPSVRASVMAPGNTDIAPNAGDVASLVALWGACPAK